jgi:hypothetical protein
MVTPANSAALAVPAHSAAHSMVIVKKFFMFSSPPDGRCEARSVPV